ncbi:hypothetical protein BVY02_01270 [bacterium J17]|nr:hypothetical protein BVY02_01270 [bacterium J17]
MSKTKTKKEKQSEISVRRLVKALRNRGLEVRREPLSRGSNFRVKSGNCLLAGEKIVFVDRRLPAEQQISLLIDYVIDLDIELSEKEMEFLSPGVREMASRNKPQVELA